MTEVKYGSTVYPVVYYSQQLGHRLVTSSGLDVTPFGYGGPSYRDTQFTVRHPNLRTQRFVIEQAEAAMCVDAHYCPVDGSMGGKALYRQEYRAS